MIRQASLTSVNVVDSKSRLSLPRKACSKLRNASVTMIWALPCGVASAMVENIVGQCLSLSREDRDSQESQRDNGH